MLVYIVINSILLILEGNVYYSVPFILLISICSVLISSYNSSKRLNISIFNLLNIALVTYYITLDNYMISIILAGVYSAILYKILYKSIYLRTTIVTKN